MPSSLADGAVVFLQAAFAGLVVCVPPGGVTPLCVDRSVRHGTGAGFVVAAGAAVGDAIYGALAAFGVATLSGSLGLLPRIVAIVAAPLLAVMALKFLRRGREAATAQRAGRELPLDTSPPTPPLTAAGASLVMSLATPGTLPAFVALFAAFGIGAANADDRVTPFVIATGVLVGALAWWGTVAALARRFRDRVAGRLHVIDLAGGVLLLLAAVAAVHVAITGAGLPQS